MTSFEEIAHQSLRVHWIYKLHGESESRLIRPDGATRDEILQHLTRKFPGRPVQYLKPGGVV